MSGGKSRGYFFIDDVGIVNLNFVDTRLNLNCADIRLKSDSLSHEIQVLLMLYRHKGRNNIFDDFDLPNLTVIISSLEGLKYS